MDKEQRKQYMKAYCQANKEKTKAYDKAYHKAHRAQNNAKSKAYWIAHPGKAKVSTKAYYELHKKERRAYAKIYRKANKDQVKAYNKAWNEANPENNRDICRKRRALKRTTQVERINEKIVFMRDGWLCQICHKRVDKKLKHPDLMSPSLDHITPLNKGGTHTYDNVQLAHLSCNTRKQDKILPQGEQMRMF